NFSFEFVEGLLSFEFNRSVRAYGGGRWIFNVEPENYDGLSAQYGIELQAPSAILGDRLRPVAFVDVQHREERDWQADISVKAGVSLEDENRLGRRLMLLAEFYDGTNYNGQFYSEDMQTYGLGVHLFF